MNKYYIIREDNDIKLEHHGIKGQHWGIRRYQNEDGSLTEEGKKRYGTIGLKEVSLERIQADRDSYMDKISTTVENLKKANELEKQARELADKYDFDKDDGGGGSTKESQKAGQKYYELWEEIDRLRYPYEHDDALYERNKKITNEYLTKKYGTYRMKMLSIKENAPIVAAGSIFLTGVLAAIGGTAYMVIKDLKK